MDTIILKIYGPSKFKIKHLDWFLPELSCRTYADLSPTEQKSQRIYLRHFVLHPPYQDRYVPKVEIFETLGKDRKSVIYILKTEFSVPKLLFGNSLQEAGEVHKSKIISALKQAFLRIGIQIEEKEIADARLAAFHICKNVPLPHDIRMQEALTELKRVDISKVVDVTEKEEKNGGRWVHIYSGNVERVFYDKIADAMRPKNKRKDKGKIDFERSVVEKFGLQRREVFRYEYRVKKTQTVAREINHALGREPKTTVAFKDLFSKDLIKMLLLKSWRDLIQRPENQLALLGPKDDLAMLQHMLSQAKVESNAHCLNKALTSYGLACTIRNHGAKEVKRTVFTAINEDHSERLTKKIQKSAELAKGIPFSNTIAYIDRNLESFELIDWNLLENGL